MSGTPVWDAIASADDLAALAPGVPDDLDRSPDVLVVGGGVIGLATAAMCVRAGLGSVVVLEREPRLASAASGRAAGGLAPDVHMDEGEAYQRLARRSLELHRELDAQWGYGLRLRDEIVCLRDADGEDACGFVPQLAQGWTGIHIPTQANVDTLRLAAALACHAGQTATGVEVTGVGPVVATSAGEFRPRAVVLATGIVPQVSVQQSWVKGHLIATEPAGFELACDLASADTLVIQREDGRLIAGGTLDEGDDEPVVRDDVVERIRRALVALLPDAADLEVTHAWCCFRPATPARLPVIERLADDVWASCGHFRTGLLMAPATGEAIAEWIATGERPERVAALGYRS